MRSKKITRRDFCNGIAIGTGISLLSPMDLFGQNAFTIQNPKQPFTYYPPTLTGMRGSHTGSFETAHALAWAGQKPTSYETLDEEYDLIVVGAGISGLATARFYQKKMGMDSRILLLDNHDDFGGHAKRNEFQQDGRTLLSIGGSVNLDNPQDYSEISRNLLNDLGVDLDSMAANIDDNYPLSNPSANNALAIPGPDGHVITKGNWVYTMQGVGDIKSTIESLPLAESEQQKLIQFLGGKHDYLDDLSLREKYNYIQSTSYSEFLTKRVGIDEDTAAIFYSMIRLLYCVDGKSVSVSEAISTGAPGLQAMGAAAKIIQYLGLKLDSSESLYFPDGNSSISRLLVQKLIPAVTSGDANFDNIATSYFDYSMLDRSDHSIRLRLNSTVVGVRHKHDDWVEVDYVKNGNATRVIGNHCVLACYNKMIPHLCPELPQSQKEGLSYAEKGPLVWANVHLTDGIAFSQIDANLISCPNDPFDVVTISPPTSTGNHQPSQKPEDPMVLFLMSIPKVKSTGTESPQELYRLGHRMVYSTSFSTYEQQIRNQLQALLGDFGFNHETDIKAITVNRWPHGYAYEYFKLHDPEWDEGQAPHEIGRAQFRKISIANSDSEAYAYVNAAIDSAWRAVEEQTS